MERAETRLLDADEMATSLDRIARQIADNRLSGAPLRLVGIRTRGVPLADRLAQLIGGEVPVAAVDITLYRDDLGRQRHWPVLKGTEIPFEIDEADVVLVDDVLFTGRTVRAALNAICDLGRPARVRLAVLVDRGGQELPIRADHVGTTIRVDVEERIEVRLRPIDPSDEVVRVSPAPA